MLEVWQPSAPGLLLVLAGRADQGQAQVRSKTPGGAVHEIWALLYAYHAVRELISAAAALARENPLRICFTNALDVDRGLAGTPGSFPLAGLTGSAETR